MVNDNELTRTVLPKDWSTFFDLDYSSSVVPRLFLYHTSNSLRSFSMHAFVSTALGGRPCPLPGNASVCVLKSIRWRYWQSYSATLLVHSTLQRHGLPDRGKQRSRHVSSCWLPRRPVRKLCFPRQHRLPGCREYISRRGHKRTELYTDLHPHTCATRPTVEKLLALAAGEKAFKD